ncbi:MAG: homogentisate 1,2-dioxygenase [Solirubrobacterales bacterium]|nr:homogentisate 1,2-dioxygenase [Solirubrobacterales bacterium]MBV9164951.1 homogentisate 1,2-dioxygenase [Solirubrobacterales bacterium]MBV9534710.1 homogentisate 1,2-dioxygenase [Solirubrobacterales bacterium]
MRYASLGTVPAKRHSQFQRNGTLLVEEVMGYEGFSGNESILYHAGSPCRIAEVGPLRRLERLAWDPEVHVHRLADLRGVEAGGDPLGGRRLLMFNDDIEVSVCKPTDALEGFYRNGEGDEVIYVHRGRGVLRTVFGRVAFRERDYLVIPRGTTVAWELDPGEQFWLCFHTPGEIETPARYRNRYGQLLEHAPYSQRDFRPPAGLETVDDPGEHRLMVRVRAGLQEFLLDRHPFDVVGWDGYVWPYAFNAMDFEPRAGRFHLPPPSHQTFQGQGFVLCTFAPRLLDWDPEAVPLPYHHSNIQSEEVMFYADGDYRARKGVEIGSVTLHPSGLPHGPQPGAVERALGAKRTDELAVMWDTFRPLRLTPLWQANDRPEYAYSWNPEHQAAGGDGRGPGEAETVVTGPSA